MHFYILIAIKSAADIHNILQVVYGKCEYNMGFCVVWADLLTD